jgi:4-hydroxy-tetrahydrodipicolinate synthase
VGFNAHGGQGCISVTANVAPKLCAEMQEATLRGEYDAARAIDAKLAALHKALFVEPSPAPAKYACSLLGLCSEEVRLPLVPCTDAAKGQVKAAMTQAGLL